VCHIPNIVRDENPIEPTVILNQMGWFQKKNPEPKKAKKKAKPKN
jgi:hypothetical protein